MADVAGVGDGVGVSGGVGGVAVLERLRHAQRPQREQRQQAHQANAHHEDRHEEIEEWDFRGGRIFAAVGSTEDESNPLSGYGWMCPLIDAGAIGAAGFQRVRKAVLLP